MPSKLMMSSKRNFMFVQCMLRVAVLRQSAVSDETFLRPTPTITV